VEFSFLNGNLMAPADHPPIFNSWRPIQLGSGIHGPA
jgi:hypothetical protein